MDLDRLLYPLEWFVAAIMVGFHRLFSFLGIPPASGWAWCLSIVGLVVVLRILLIPLFVKQIHASRRMQLIQPEMQKIQKKYKGKTDPESRQAMTQETMALYKRSGTNPGSACLPVLLQSPFFFALFRVLNHLPKISDGTFPEIGPLTRELAAQAESSTLLGAPLSSGFLHATTPTAKVVTVVLIVAMSVTTFTTQRQLMMKNMPASALDNPFARQQKVLLYLMPIFFAISGINFPIGVLLYWLTTNIWSMGQQFYVIRRMPAPGSLAEKALEERRARKGKPHTRFSIPGLHGEDHPPKDDGAVPQPGSSPAAQDRLTDRADTPPTRPSGQRQQPKRKGRRRPPRPGPESKSQGATG